MVALGPYEQMNYSGNQMEHDIDCFPVSGNVMIAHALA